MRRVIINHAFWVVFLSLGLAVGVANADIESGLLGYWPLDGDGTDASGNDLHGTISGSVSPVADRFGTADSALWFPGASNSYVEIADSPILQLTGEMTLAAWVYLDGSNTNNARIFAKSGGGGARSWSLNIERTAGGVQNPATFQVGIDNGANNVSLNDADPLPTDEWVHMAGVYRPGEAMEVYVNGVLKAINTSNVPASQFGNNGRSARIGNRNDCGDCGWIGAIDEVRIYNRALSDMEIRQVMAGSLVSAGPDQRVLAGTTVTLSGTGPDDATSFSWVQTGGLDQFEATLEPFPDQQNVQFDTPVVEVGFVLTFELTVVSESEGTVTDDVIVTVLAPNEPRIAPANLRAYPGDLAFTLQWDPLVDANDYGVGLKLGPGVYFWFWTEETDYPLTNLNEGEATTVAVKGRNSYGDGVLSEEITLVPMRNYALPPNLGGKSPPSAYVYVISHYTIADMNNKEIEGDTNDSWDGNAKSEDYWGYLWPNPLYFDHVTYHTGNMFSNGGWFLDLTVQYTEDGTTWIAVPTTISPGYDFRDTQAGHEAYARYDLSIPTLRGSGIRIYGTPGGSATFTSISELEVFGDQATVRPLVVQGIDAEVPERTTATLDGSYSFSTRGDITSGWWEQVGGPAVTIETTAEPLIATFDAPGVDEDTLFVFKLTAGDGTETLSDEDVRITVKNIVTTAVAGVDQNVTEGVEATLDGSASLTTSGSLTYAWTQTVGPPVTLSDPSSDTCSFTAPVIWDFMERLTFRLEVNDGVGGVSTDEVNVYVTNVVLGLKPLGSGYFQDLLHLGQTPQDRFTAPLLAAGETLATLDYLANWGGQANINPMDGDEYDFTGTGITTTVNPMVWTPIHSDSGVFGEEAFENFGQIYHIYVFSPEERDARMRYRCDDDMYVWNNGLAIVTRDTWDGDTELSQNFTLHEGINSMTLRFEEQAGGNRLAARITDRANVPYTDLWYALSVPVPLPAAYAVRTLPASYQPGGTVDVGLSMRADTENPPTSVTVSEVIPAGLSVANPGGGQIIGGTLNWSVTGEDVEIYTITYSLGVPAEVSGVLNFEGTATYPGGDPDQGILGDRVVYEVPSAPQNLDVEMLLTAWLSWSASPQEGVVAYRLYSSVNGQAWQPITYVTGTSYTDSSIAPGSTYKYKVAAVNRSGVEGPASSPTDEKMITMQIREAEDYNYGGGRYPGYQQCPAAVEATAADDLAAGNDFYFASTFPVGDPAREYRPNDDLRTAVRGSTRYIGSITPADWWRFTFDVPVPGPGDPEGGWVKIDVRVSSPGGGTAQFYWDENPVGSVNFVTGDWGAFVCVPVEEQFQTTPGEHTLRVTLASGEMNFDKLGIGFNWTPPKRQVIFEDDFEDYTTLYVPDDAIAAGWFVQNGSGYPDARWRLWNTAAAQWLGSEDPNIAGVTNNYMITDSDLAPEADMDEGLITPEIDCTNWLWLRLDFSKNFRIYPDDTTHLQVGEVDIRVYDEETSSWGDWVTLLHYDRTTVADINSSPEQVDLSAYDERRIQIRWHFHQATYDYWFAVDDIVLSGEMKEIPVGEVLYLGLVEGKVQLTWEEFGGGNYTVEYADDLTSDWQPVPGVAWPITETTWPGESIGALPTRYYRVRSE